MKFSFSELNKKMLSQDGGGGSPEKENNDHEQVKSNYDLKNILIENLNISSIDVLFISSLTSLLIYFLSYFYEKWYGIPALYFYDLDIKNIIICIICALIIFVFLFYIIPHWDRKYNNNKSNCFTKIIFLIIFLIISALNAKALVSILFVIPAITRTKCIFIISLGISFLIFYNTYNKNFVVYHITCVVTTIIIITALIITSGHANPFYKTFELLDYQEDNYPIYEDKSEEDKNESIKSWRLLKDRVVIGHYKDKLIVMDGLVKEDELVVLKPGYKLIDGSNAKIESKIFAVHKIKDKDYFYPDISRTQKINDNTIERNKVLKLNTNEIYSEELSITSKNHDEDKIDNYLNKLVCKVVSSGNFIFSDISILEKNSDKKLNDEDFDIIKNDRGFSISLNEGGIDKLYNTTEGLIIRYKARLGNNLRDDEYNFIATYFDYGFNEQDMWNNGAGNSKDGKITLSVKFNEKQERSNKIVNSIYTLQEKSSDGWKDVSFITSDSLNDFEYTFSGLDDKKLYRIQAIHADNYISDYLVIQDGKANIINIKDEDDFVKNKVSIQRFNMDKKGGDIVNLGV